MKSNLPNSIGDFPAGKYWLCDPLDVMPDHLFEKVESGEEGPGLMTCPHDEDAKFYVVDMERGIGTWCFEKWDRFNSVYSETGYIGIFPDEMIRGIRMVTFMKKMPRNCGAIEVNMGEAFSIESRDGLLYVGDECLSMILGE